MKWVNLSLQDILFRLLKITINDAFAFPFSISYTFFQDVGARPTPFLGKEKICFTTITIWLGFDNTPTNFLPEGNLLLMNHKQVII